MNLKNFTKIKDTKDHVIIKHSEGHEIKVSKAHLSDHHRQMLEALPLNDKGKKTLSSESKKAPKFAKGGFIKAENGAPMVGVRGRVEGASGSGFPMYADGGESDDGKESPEQAPASPNASLDQAQADLAKMQEPAPDSDTSEQPLDKAQQDLNSLQPPADASAPKPEVPMPENMEKEQQDLAVKSADDIAKGQRQIAATEQEKQTALSDLKNTFDTQVAEEDNKVKAAQKEFDDAKVNPDRYYANLSTGQKISNAVGLILGGLGAGATNGKNMGAEFIQKQIDADITQQQEELGKKKTLLSAAIEHTGSVEKGMQFARALALDTAASKIAQAAAKSNSAQAQNNGAAAVVALKQQSDAIKQKMAADQVKNAVLFPEPGQVGTEAGYRNNLHQTQAIDPKLGKEKEEKYIPGVGVASIKIPDKERTEIRKLGEYKDLVTKAQDFTNRMGTVGAISPESRAEAESLKNMLTARMNDTTGLTRLTHNEVELYKGIVGDLGSFNFGGLTQKMKDLKEATEKGYKNQLDSLGVVPFNKPDQSSVAKQWLNSPEAQKPENAEKVARLRKVLGQ